MMGLIPMLESSEIEDGFWVAFAIRQIARDEMAGIDHGAQIA